jgi:hypothetical protein
MFSELIDRPSGGGFSFPPDDLPIEVDLEPSDLLSRVEIETDALPGPLRVPSSYLNYSDDEDDEEDRT